jgi:hypothetical protein
LEAVSVGLKTVTDMPFEALTPLTPLSLGERGEQEESSIAMSFSLLSLRERRAGEVRASEGIPRRDPREH